MASTSILDSACLPIHMGSAQHIGNRDSQQDAWGFSDLSDAAFASHGGYLTVLADGMGGLENGLWASNQGVRAFIAAYQTKTPEESITDALVRAMSYANQIVHGEAAQLGLEDRMGTTLVAAVVQRGKLYWINVGDSRVYLCTDGQLCCLSTDHNFSEVLAGRVRRGEISLAEAQEHPMRNGLTSYVGRSSLALVDVSAQPLDLAPDAWVLLCSDGLSGVLREDEIVRQLHGTPQEAADRLIDVVLRQAMPHQDNVTVTLLQAPAPASEEAPVLITESVSIISPAPASEAAPLAVGQVIAYRGDEMTGSPFDEKPNRTTRRNPLVWYGLGTLGLSMAAVLAGYWHWSQPSASGSVVREMPASSKTPDAPSVRIAPVFGPNTDTGFAPERDVDVAEKPATKNTKESPHDLPPPKAKVATPSASETVPEKRSAPNGSTLERTGNGKTEKRQEDKPPTPTGTSAPERKEPDAPSGTSPAGDGVSPAETRSSTHHGGG